jgi:ankyrin repeat protein
MSSDSIGTANWVGNTALHLAALMGYKEICRLLLPKMSLKAINNGNRWGDTALHYAAKRGYKEICEILISKMSIEAIIAVDANNKKATDYLPEIVEWVMK